MIPIFEQGSGRGIGHNIRTFVDRFGAICEDHANRDQASAFAFIFYDFNNQSLRRILKDQGVFVKLDRLAGTKLSIFFLHIGTRGIVEAFNSYFLTLLGVKEHARVPCLVFFRVNDQKVMDVEVAQLDSTDLIHGFTELYGAVESYLQNQRAAPAVTSSTLTWTTGRSNVVHLDAFRDALRKVF